ncbi:hypothetical protein B0H11DRAFT_2263550 [Mycena galericulata]|nr:hypothetical protein B0H11DRAFT_2263550 [Mycena galericulata]
MQDDGNSDDGREGSPGDVGGGSGGAAKGKGRASSSEVREEAARRRREQREAHRAEIIAAHEAEAAELQEQAARAAQMVQRLAELDAEDSEFDEEVPIEWARSPTPERAEDDGDEENNELDSDIENNENVCSACQRVRAQCLVRNGRSACERCRTKHILCSNAGGPVRPNARRKAQEARESASGPVAGPSRARRSVRETRSRRGEREVRDSTKAERAQREQKEKKGKKSTGGGRRYRELRERMDALVNICQEEWEQSRLVAQAVELILCGSAIRNGSGRPNRDVTDAYTSSYCHIRHPHSRTTTSNRILTSYGVFRTQRAGNDVALRAFHDILTTNMTYQLPPSFSSANPFRGAWTNAASAAPQPLQALPSFDDAYPSSSPLAALAPTPAAVMPRLGHAQFQTPPASASFAFVPPAAPYRPTHGLNPNPIHYAPPSNPTHYPPPQQPHYPRQDYSSVSGYGGELGPPPRTFRLSSSAWKDEEKLSLEADNWIPWEAKVLDTLGLEPGALRFIRGSDDPPPRDLYPAHHRAWVDSDDVVRSFLTAACTRSERSTAGK